MAYVNLGGVVGQPLFIWAVATVMITGPYFYSSLINLGPGLLAHDIIYGLAIEFGPTQIKILNMK